MRWGIRWRGGLGVLGLGVLVMGTVGMGGGVGMLVVRVRGKVENREREGEVKRECVVKSEQ